jgi:arylsulfatase A-like enzyme
MAQAPMAGRRPYEGFEGRVGKTFADSQSWWPPRTEARRGNPNVLMIIVDDLGFSDLGCYGSEISTPNIDRLAEEGLRYTNFHVTPLCSPTRASLFTGCESHSVGFGFVANVDPGFPGYSSELPHSQPTMAEVFRDHGYATMAIGKWHLCRDADMHEAADKHSWPMQRGFDQYYGFLEALTNFHHPHRMYRGNSVVEVDQVPDDYYLTDDLTTEAIKMIKAQKAADSEKPFFMYFAHGAVHAPLHVKRDDLETYRGRYEMGWDELRRQRYERQIELGVIDSSVELAPRNSEKPEDVKAWDELSDKEKALYARYMECYAGMVDNVDQNTGRLVSALEDMGELDNTLILFFSDNGASREGQAQGTTSYFGRSGTNVPIIGTKFTDVVDDDYERIDEIGGPTNWPHYPRGWAMASNTPFRLYKMTAFAGGHQVAFIARWPQRLRDRGAFRRQFVHVTDLIETFAAEFGFTIPNKRNGEPAVPRIGTSFAATFDDPDAPSNHDENFIEVIGHRSFYRKGWEIVTFHPPTQPYSDEEWQLFNVEDDPTQVRNLAASHAHKLQELADGWEQAAHANQTYPLYDGTGLSRAIRPPDQASLRRPVTIYAGTPTLERFRSAQLIHDHSFTITVRFYGDGLRSSDEGVLVAHGGQEAGYILYVEDSALVFGQLVDGRLRTMQCPAPIGATTLTVDVAAPGRRIWNVRVLMGDAATGTVLMAGEGFHQYISFLPFEGIDVGIDRRSPVSWDLYQRHGCFPFTGHLHSVHYELGEPSPDAAFMRIDELRAMAFKYE